MAGSVPTGTPLSPSPSLSFSLSIEDYFVMVLGLKAVAVYSILMRIENCSWAATSFGI